MKWILGTSVILLLGFNPPALAEDVSQEMPLSEIAALCKSADRDTGATALTAVTVDSEAELQHACQGESRTVGFEFKVESVSGYPPPPDELNERYGMPPYEPGGER